MCLEPELSPSVPGPMWLLPPASKVLQRMVGGEPPMGGPGPGPPRGLGMAPAAGLEVIQGGADCGGGRLNGADLGEGREGFQLGLRNSVCDQFYREILL